MPSVYDYVNGDNEATSKVRLKIRFLVRFFLILDFQKGYVGLTSCHMVLYESFLLLNSYMTQFIHENWLSDAFSAAALSWWNIAITHIPCYRKSDRKQIPLGEKQPEARDIENEEGRWSRKRWRIAGRNFQERNQVCLF